MLPTTYRGDATVAGEELDAELFLDHAHLRLMAGAGGRSEIVKWPLPTVRIEPVERGRYRFRAGRESFEFSPLVDDGLGDEIAMRTRFAVVLEPADETPWVGSPEATERTIADRVRTMGRRRHHRGGGVMSGGDLALRTALVILGVLALVVTTVAVMSGTFDQDQPATVEISPEAMLGDATLPFTDDTFSAVTVPDSPVTTVADSPVTTVTVPDSPVTTVADSPVTTVAESPATTVPASPTTTAPQSEEVPPTPAVDPGLELAPQAFVERWDDVSTRLGDVLPATQVEMGDGVFSFQAGTRTTVEGTVGSDGTVETVTLLGDPDGTIEEDRLVITAMGMAIAVAAPDLEPEGRRALLETLGFEFEDPQVAELDGALTYLTYEYRLRWDEESRRIVFEVGPIGFE
jgi:hypothetical protein